MKATDTTYERCKGSKSFIFYTGTVILVAIAAFAMSPWQLFQSLCPYVSAQSPQCEKQQQLTISQPPQQYQGQQQQLPQTQQQLPSSTPTTTVSSFLSTPATSSEQPITPP